MKILNIIFIVSLTFLTMSCALSLIDYDYDYDREANFARLRTFAWLPVELQANALVIKHIEVAVNRELEAKGFMKNQENPDFLIAIHGRKVRKREATWYDLQGRKRDVRIYDEGTYRLVIVDADSRATIWEGTALRQSDDDALFFNVEKRNKLIIDMVANILKNFPPPKI